MFASYIHRSSCSEKGILTIKKPKDSLKFWILNIQAILMNTIDLPLEFIVELVFKWASKQSHLFEGLINVQCFTRNKLLPFQRIKLYPIDKTFSCLRIGDVFLYILKEILFSFQFISEHQDRNLHQFYWNLSSLFRYALYGTLLWMKRVWLSFWTL